MKRKLALLLAMVMVFVSVPFTGLAEMQPAEEMNFAEFLPEAAAVEEAVAQEVTEAVAAEETDTTEGVEESDLALAGEGQGGGQMKTYPDITATVATPSYSFGGENKTAKVAECRFDNWTGNSYLLEVAADSQVTVSFGDINPEPLANMKILYFPQGSHPIVYGYSGNGGTFTFKSEAVGRYYLLLFEGKFPWEGGGQQGGGSQGGENGKVKFTLEGKEPKVYDLADFNSGDVSIGRILDNFGIKEGGKSVKDAYMDGPSNYGIQKTGVETWKILPTDGGESGKLNVRYQNANHEISVTRTGEQENFSFVLSCGEKNVTYTESELNSDQGVSLGRLLDELEVRTGDNPDPIDDAWTNGECPVRFGSMRMEEWLVRCGSNQPGNGTLVIVYGGQSGDQTYRFGLQFEENQQGGPGYEGPRGIFRTNRQLHAQLDGWDYGNSSWIADNDGNQPVKVEYDKERNLYDIQINVKPELWNRVYNNTDLSRGIRVKLYFEKPDDSVIGYRCDYRGGTEQGNDMMNSVLSLDPILFSNQHSSVQENAPAVNVMNAVISSADEAVLVPIREEGLLGYAWFTEVSPKKQAYVFEGEGENVKNFELAHFKITHVNEQDVAVKNESVLSENYLFTDSDRTYTNAGVLFGTDYQSGRLTYTLDADAVEAKEGKVGFFREKPVVTKISVPGATEISAVAVGEAAPVTVVSGADPACELLIKAEIADGSGDWNFGTRRSFAYRISYKMNERTFSKLLTIEITKRYSGIVYDKVGFRPVGDSRILFDLSLTDSDKGFYLDKNGHGEIVTKWSGKSVNMDRVNRQITVSVPTDITGIKGYRIWTAEGNIGLRDGNEQEAIEIRDGRLKNMELRDIPENGQVSMRAFYLPQEFMVDGKRVYSLAGRSPAVNENSICFIDWVYEDGGQEKDCFEYYYWTTEAGHTDVTMPESIHKDSGSSEPMLYQVVLNGVTKNKDDYFLRVKYYGRSGNGYDYYKIDLVDKDGHVLDLKNGNAKVTVKFTYPDGTSKEKLTNINTFLTHFEDETYSVKDQEQIRFEEDGIYVDLSHFSPFLLTWGADSDRIATNSNYVAEKRLGPNAVKSAEVSKDGNVYTVNYTVDYDWLKDNRAQYEEDLGGRPAVRLVTGIRPPEGAGAYRFGTNNVRKSGEMVTMDVILVDNGEIHKGRPQTYEITWFAGEQDKNPIGSDTVVINVKDANMQEIHPQASDLQLNAQHLDNAFFVDGPRYDAAAGIVDVCINRRTAEQRQSSGGSNDFAVVYKLPKGYSEVSVDGAGREGDRVVCVLQMKDRDDDYEKLKKDGFYQRFVTIHAKENGKDVLCTFTLRVVLKDVDIPSRDRFIPSENEKVQNCITADGRIAYEVSMAEVQTGETLETGLLVPQGMDDITQYRVNGQQEASPLRTDHQDRKYAAVITALPEGLAEESVEKYTIFWCDAAGKEVLESVFFVAVKPAETGEQVLMTPFKDGDFSFRIIGWPDNEKDPFTVEYKNNAYYIHMNMTQEDWQKAYDNRPAGEYNLRLKMYLKTVPDKAAAYAVMSSGNMLDQKREEEVVNTLTGGGSEYFPAEGEMFRNSDLLFADYTEGNDAATVAPRPNKNGMMKSLAWKDANGFQMNVGAPGTISHVKYALVYIDFADPRPVSVKTSGYKADGRDILPNYNKVAGKYFLEGKPVELDGNCVRYYLDGDALTADRQAGENTPKTIVTGFRAPEGAVAYEFIGDNLERSGGKHNLPSDRVAPFELGFYVYSIESYEDVFSADFQILWHMNDGSVIRSGNLSVYAAVARKVNTLDENGWNRIEADRITLPQIYSENCGIAIEKEAGHLHTKFTGDPLNEEIYEDENSMFRITVPKFGGAKPAYYEMTGWEGADLFGSFRYSIDEAIGFGEKNPVGDSDWIGFRYEGLPEKRELIENGTTYLIYQGREFGVNRNCTGQLYVRWYDTDKKTLGTEWLYITADPCYKEYVVEDHLTKDLTEGYIYNGVGKLASRVQKPTLINASENLYVREYITASKGKRSSSYFVIHPIDEKRFEIATGTTEVMMPYPEGMNRENAASWKMNIYHYNDETALTKGKDVSVFYEEYGIRMQTEGFSPFLLTWEEVSEYEVTFAASPGTYGSVSQETITVPEGTAVTVNGDTVTIGEATITATPAKENEQYTYTLKEWANVPDTITGDVTITAVFESTVNKYTVTWRNWDHSELEKDENVEYGATPEYNGETPTKAADSQYSYSFKAWDPAVSAVTGNVTYTATYDSTVNEYAVTIGVNESGYGTITSSGETVAYGTSVSASGAELTIGEKKITAAPTAAGAQYTYSFKEWTGIPEDGKITGATTITAVFGRTVNKYTVTWKNWNGTELEKDENVAYGTMPAYDGKTPEKAADEEYSYTFSRWSPEVSTVTGNATYTAVYDRTPLVKEPVNEPVDISEVKVDEDNREAVEEIAGNTSVDTKKSAEEVQAAVKDIVQAVVNAAGQGLDEKDIKSVQIRVETVLKAVETEDGTVSSVKYTVEPVATVERKNGKETIDVKIGNESLSGEPITIRLAVPGNVIGDHAKVQHKHAKGGTDVFIVPILGTNPNRYVEFTITNFSEFELDFVDACIVTWKDEDGTVLQEGPVEKGTMPVYEGRTPAKASTAYYRYEFAGWVPEVKAVTEDALYIAQFRSIAIYDDGRSSYSYSSSSGKKNTAAITYSPFWQKAADGSWTVKDRSGRTVTNAWLCDDAVKANGQNVWYLLGADGKMETAPLVQDATGNYYSLETSHNGFYGSLRYKNGNYDGIYMEFSQKHDGTFGRIINQSAIDALKEKYGVKQYGVDNSSCVATSAF